MTRASLRGLLLVLLVLPLAGCVRSCTSSRPPIHINPNMDQQPKAKAQTESGFFYDGSTMRPPVPGTVARGELHDDGPRYTGKDAWGEPVAKNPLAVDEILLARGERQYGIYCAPCHDARGRGRGILFQRGGVPTTSLHEERLLDKPDGHFFDVITNGIGLMPGYRWPITADDRWAIVAYVRTLQGVAPRPAPATARGPDAVGSTLAARGAP